VRDRFGNHGCRERDHLSCLSPSACAQTSINQTVNYTVVDDPTVCMTSQQGTRSWPNTTVAMFLQRFDAQIMQLGTCFFPVLFFSWPPIVFYAFIMSH